jgi:hypothetical protein
MTPEPQEPDLRTLVQCHVTKAEDFHKRMDAKVGHLVELLTGDNQKPGLLTRVDRVEQVQKRWSWWMGAGWAALLTLVAGWLFDRSR